MNKLDEELCDYHGKCWRTYEDEECEEMMEDIVYPVDPKYMHFSEKTKILSDKDKELLVEYAPKLFNTSTNIYGLKDDMYELVHLVWKYRLHQSKNFVYNIVIENYSNTLQNDQATYRNGLVTHIDGILNILNMTHDVVFENNKLPSSKDVKAILKVLRDNVDTYLPRKPKKLSADKDRTLGKYLRGLKLKDKSDTIKEFLRKLDSDTHTNQLLT